VIDISSAEIQKYIIDPTLPKPLHRWGGKANAYHMFQYEDNTEWIMLDNQLAGRFCGFLFLQQALKDAGYNHIIAAENKLAIIDDQVCYLSRYCGEELPPKPKGMSFLGNPTVDLTEIGFTDGNANLRMKNGINYVFDTEKGSFHSSVHAQIDAFMPLHDKIRACADQILASRQTAASPTTQEAEMNVPNPEDMASSDTTTRIDHSTPTPRSQAGQSKLRRARLQLQLLRK
jgi:hypothetical protein